MTKDELLKELEHVPGDWEIHDGRGVPLYTTTSYSMDKVAVLHFRKPEPMHVEYRVEEQCASYGCADHNRGDWFTKHVGMDLVAVGAYYERFSAKDRYRLVKDTDGVVEVLS